MKLLPLLAVTLLFACSAPAAEQVVASRPDPKTQMDLPPAACQAAGGAITKVCRRQVERCLVPYADAGKACSDDADCQGMCLMANGEAKPEGNVGTCQKDPDPCGCFFPLEKGRLSDRARCVD